MTTRAYADLLIQAYGYSIALSIAEAEAGGHGDLDGYWTEVLAAMKGWHKCFATTS